MKRFFSGLIALLFALALAYLLIANRQPAYLNLDATDIENPALAFETYTAVHIVVGLVIGFVLGALGMYSSGAGRRAELRARRREIHRLREELREARQGIYQTEGSGRQIVDARDAPPASETLRLRG